MLYQKDNELNVIMEAPEEESQQSSKNLLEVHNKNQKIYEDQIAYLSGDTYNLPIQLIKDFTTKREEQYKNQKLRTFCEIMKEKEREKKKLEEKFQRLLREQAVYLIHMDKQKRIEKALEKTIKPEKIKPAIQNMLSEQKQSVSSKPLVQNQKEKDAPSKRERIMQEQNDQLKNEIEILKQQNNDNQEIIKTLKIQINKFQSGKDLDSTTNSSTISRGSNKTKSELMQEEIERLHEEIASLKKVIHEERQSYKTQLSRVQKVQSALASQKQKVQKEAQQTQAIHVDPEKLQKDLEKTRIELNQQACEFRQKQILNIRSNRLKEQQSKLNSLNEIIQKKDKLISELLLKLDDKKTDQFTNKISQLEKQLIEKDEEINEIKETYMIDNQIRLLFPKNGNMVVALMNFMMKFEEDFTQQDKTRFIFIYFKKQWFKLLTGIKKVFTLTRNPIYHPKNQELIKLAVQQIRACPTVLEKQIQHQSKEIESLKFIQDELSSNIKAYHKIKEEFEFNQERYSRIDQILRKDKIELANNMMMKIVNSETQKKAELNEELALMKEYCTLIYKSTFLDEPQKQISPPKKQEKIQKKEKKDAIPLREPICTKKERHKKREASNPKK